MEVCSYCEHAAHDYENGDRMCKVERCGCDYNVTREGFLEGILEDIYDSITFEKEDYRQQLCDILDRIAGILNY